MLGEFQAEGVEAGGDWGAGEVVEENLEVITLTPGPSPKGEGRKAGISQGGGEIVEG